MREMTPEELILVMKIRRITKKSILVCLMCLRYNQGDFQKALKFCSESTPEKE